MSWHVLWVLTGCERETAERLEGLPGIRQTVCPMQQMPFRRGGTWVYEEKPVIPSYVFAEAEQMSPALYEAGLGLPGVIDWLRAAGSIRPSEVPPKEMAPVLLLAGGAPPERTLQNVRLNRHKRRGRGELTVGGETRTITFPIMQADEGPVDERPGTEAAEQRRGG